MHLHIGLDDTDSTNGMCTTYAVTELISKLDFPILLGYPRLVRLNPNIPWKTRGNGALAFTIGGSAETAFKIGEVSGRPVLASFEEGNGVVDELEITERAAATIEALAAMEDENTNPGLIVSVSRPPPSFYWRAVRYVVEREEALSNCRVAGANIRDWKNGRGVIGAAAAVAWQPGLRTYEVITYRENARFGSSRDVNEEDASLLSERFPSTFNNYDSDTRHMCISPASPCPVLFGIRGNDPSVLQDAMKSISSEHIDRWLIFESNQGTDDHILKMDGNPVLFCSYLLTGEVKSLPETITGGHVFFELKCKTLTVKCAAFEETKGLRNIVRKLVPGDRVAVWGAYKAGSNGATLNIEKVAILSLARRLVKVGNPLCTECGRNMESVGKDKGYRCRRCKTASKEPRVRETGCEISTGLYSATASSRRHLSRPPELMTPYELEEIANVWQENDN
jgi:tRNA(Ile2)-agmatinylcytidine synthase